MSNVCFHCNQLLEAEQVIFDEKKFCCLGCKTVYEILNNTGLEDFYQMNDEAGVRPDAKDNHHFDFLDTPEIFDKIVDFSEDGITVVSFYIPVIHCTSCVWLLESLNTINPNIIYSQVNFSKKQIQLSFRHENFQLSELARLLTQLGYKPAVSLQSLDKTEQKQSRLLLYKLAVAGFCFANIMLMAFPEYTLPFSTNNPEAWLDNNKNFFRWGMFVLSLPVMFFSATDYFKSAWYGIKNKFINIDLPIAIGFWVLFLRSTYDIVFDLSAGFFDSIAGLAFFMLIGKWFQQRTYKALAFDRDYKSFYPIAVLRINNNVEEPTLLSDLKKGDRILIRNEEIIPADAILIKGEGMIDNSFVTGESRLIAKKTGDKVFAGGKQSGAAIELEIIKEVNQSYLTQLWNNDAFAKEDSALNKLTNNISQYFVATILVITLASALFWYFHDPSQILQVVTAILIITCPCALGLSSPFILGNIMRIFGEKGMYIKSTASIESMAKIDHIVFDKTGTITESQGSTVQYIGETLSPLEQKSIQSVIKNSTHPLSRILYNELKAPHNAELKDYAEITGKGQQAEIDGVFVQVGSAEFVGLETRKEINKTQVYIAFDHKIKGKYEFTNQYRKGLKGMIAQLKHFRMTLLSGDNDSEKHNLEKIFPSRTAFHFNQNPEQKLDYIRSQQETGAKVMMFGDGLNDAGAIQQSDLGLVLTEDINNFSPSCDAILKADSFTDLPNYLRLSKTAIRLIWTAFLISFGYNIVGLAFAISGNLAPVVAAIIMPISSISVVLFATISTRVASKMLKWNLE